MKNRSDLRKSILLWAGESISSVGGGLTSFGLGVYIFQRTGSAAGGMMAVVAAGTLFIRSIRSLESGAEQATMD